jgi:flagellar hook-associated protein 3 FlgL
MRISTQQGQQVAIDAMMEQQSKLSKVQQQVATGRKIFKPSEDPVAAAKIVNLRDTLDTNQQYQDNINAARARLTLEEGVMTNVTDVLQRIRELAVMANNDSHTNESRVFIAEEVEQLLDELLALANSTDSTGEFLFSGSKSKFKPFHQNNMGEFDYHGDDGQRFLQIGPRRNIATSDSGTAAFRAIRDGNGVFTTLDQATNRGSGIIDTGTLHGDYDQGTYAIVFEKVVPEGGHPEVDAYLSYKVINDNQQVIVAEGTPYKSGASIEFPGVTTAIEGEPEDGDFFVIRPSLNQDVFTTIQRFVDTLQESKDSNSGRAVLHNELNRSLTGIDLALGNVLALRSNVGARLNALDGQEEINESYNLQIKTILSDVEDLDYAEAVSDLNLKLTGLEASQKAFVKIQGISLFNYL